MATAQYSWWTIGQAISALQGRLQNTAFWSTAELQLYLFDSLRLWNALTEVWKQNYILAPSSTWNNLGTIAGSPRLRTVTDADLYTRMQYMLLEPPTGAGTWTGTNQFDLASMQYALDKRRNEVIQAAFCNQGVALYNITPNTRNVVLPDTVLEPVRAKFIPAAGFGPPVWLSREDSESFQYWEPNSPQTTGTPGAWDIISQTPLTVALDNAPNVPGQVEILSLNSGPAFAPPASTLLGLPDDWAWLPMFGALGDLLDSEPLRTDRARAQYCRQRFADGMKIIRGANWIIEAANQQLETDIMSLAKADWYIPGWDSPGFNAGGWNYAIVAGTDFMACPGASSVALTLVGNAPFLDTTGTYVQVARDVADVVLDYAQHLANFKRGGAEVNATLPMLKGFFEVAGETNKRIAKLGLFAETLQEQGQEETIDVPRQ
jgi:hypothetical protein